ncbi:efflux RND transporter periplasmic adaptor subunit [Roseomonas eburnea]|uniref:Efflux RND transporter periplasmic adaptor subunit n=2 Tax=Neoroseomonas eburnea TaxID=1346889 RepID=A0A9X9XG37_9PROT|nr:efflux RND transporter periplasmic adaptor subunit [Neoroseomonas eburnea]
MFKSRFVAAALLVATVAGCDDPAPPAPRARPVRVVTVEGRAAGETISLTGQIRARDQGSVAFRLDGRMLERPVNVGDTLRPGDVVARLDRQNQENALRSARAALSAAEAVLTQARLTFRRQQELLRDGWTPRARFDDAQQALQSAQAQVDAAQAQVRIAEDHLGYTTLSADVAGAVTAVGAEPGEVVRAGQMIVQIAREGGRDAVFDVPEQLIRTAPRDPEVEIVLTDDPRIRAVGRVREVSPQADPATRTFQVKVGIIDPPENMRLGSTVSGSIQLEAPPGVNLPASALTEANGRPAVWVVDPESRTVSLRNVEVARFDPGRVVISRGLEAGDVVVTAGVQVLRPGQRVRVQGAV